MKACEPLKVGTVVHHLTITSEPFYVDKIKYRKKCQEARCRCGRMARPTVRDLVTGKARSCGCLKGPRTSTKDCAPRPWQVADTEIFTDDCRVLWLACINEAVGAYANENAAQLTPEDLYLAEEFLFEESPFWFGDVEMTFEGLCDMLDLNADAVRKAAQKRKHAKCP